MLFEEALQAERGRKSRHESAELWLLGIAFGSFAFAGLKCLVVRSLGALFWRAVAETVVGPLSWVDAPGEAPVFAVTRMGQRSGLNAGFCPDTPARKHNVKIDITRHSVRCQVDINLHTPRRRSRPEVKTGRFRTIERV